MVLQTRHTVAVCHLRETRSSRDPCEMFSGHHLDVAPDTSLASVTDLLYIVISLNYDLVVVVDELSISNEFFKKPFHFA